MDLLHGVLQNNKALQNIIRRKRNKDNLASVAPVDLWTLEIPERYQTYSPTEGVSEQLLLADSGNEFDRILIFGRPNGLKILKNSKTWYFDGNFGVPPSLFAQVYMILAEALKDVHPIIYALLPNIKLSIHKKFLDISKKLNLI